jgi:DNA-binding LacI/PurR family transcriptional regulator
MNKKTKKMATIVDVAKLSGVSVGTVSNVLNGTAKVSHTTKQKVEEAIEALNFRPNDMARSLRFTKSNLIGFLAPDINEFYNSVAKHFVEYAYQSGYTVFYSGCGYSQERERDLIDLLLQKRAEVIVLIGGNFDDEYLCDMYNNGAKLLLLDRHIDNSGIPSVEFDNASTVRSLVGMLKKSGHKKIGFMSETICMTNLEDRYRGYVRGIADIRQELKDQFIYISDELQLNKKANAYAAMKRLLSTRSLDELPDVFVVTSDYVAVGMMDAINEFGLRVPEDIGVTGFDNSVICEYLRPPLTTIEQDVKKMGEIAWNIAADMIDDNLKSNERILLPQKIVIRNSTKIKN